MIKAIYNHSCSKYTSIYCVPNHLIAIKRIAKRFYNYLKIQPFFTFQDHRRVGVDLDDSSLNDDVPEIKHTAPQHRRYLTFDVRLLGYGPHKGK